MLVLMILQMLRMQILFILAHDDNDIAPTENLCPGVVS